MRRISTSALLLLCATLLWAQGVPFVKTYTVDDYHAHDVNFDLKVGLDGTIFVANFEGVLYYDNAFWNILHTSGIERITVTYRDKDGTIWAGGYNYFGRVITLPNGQLALQRVGKTDLFSGEVLEMWEKDGLLYFVVSNGKAYVVKGGDISLYKQVGGDASGIGLLDIIQPEAIDDEGEIKVLTDVTQRMPLGKGLTAIVDKGEGLTVADSTGNPLYRLSADNGQLLSNDVVWIDYDRHGRLWGAAENGLFAVAVPSAYSRFTTQEGLRGEVMSMAEFQHRIYVGTSDGLFRLDGNTFTSVAGIHYACWQLQVGTDGLLAATADGAYLIMPTGQQRQLSKEHTLSLLDDGRQYYSGELDGLWLTQKGSGVRKKLCELERVSKIMRDVDGTIWLKNLYGEIWRKQLTAAGFEHYQPTDGTPATLVRTASGIVAVKAEDSTPFPYPLFSFTDRQGTIWLTDAEGKGLYQWKDGRRLTTLDRLLYPFNTLTVRALLVEDGKVWIGTPNSLVVVRTDVSDPALDTEPRLLIRRITLNADSVLWGGYGQMPEELPPLDSHDRNLLFTFALDYEAVVGPTLYRYCLNDGDWTAWSDDHDAEFSSLNYGSYIFKVQARDAFGRETPVTTVAFNIRYPFYLRWYMDLLYLIAVALAVFALFWMRMRRLERDKIRLEQIVEQRTQEVRSAQRQLIKQEKMVTIGKLTQGLVDRIQNPMNYINNFSKLSEGLVSDVRANVEDEAWHISKENYEDTIDVLDMLCVNLQKIGEHGQNTSRMLKAMEELLKDRSGGVVTTDLCAILKQDKELMGTYYAQQISDHRIRIVADYPAEPVYVEANPNLLSKVIMNLLGNSVYAVVKKAERTPAFLPEISLKATADTTQATIIVRDTGTGIEQQVIDKIFDPFFTTKTTGEATGIGLYLSHDIIQNYCGQITASSVKNEFTEFTVILPVKSKSAYGTTD